MVVLVLKVSTQKTGVEISMFKDSLTLKQFLPCELKWFM